MIYKTEDLLASIKTRSLVPVSQQTFQDSDLIVLLNEEQLNSCVPEIQKAREKYFLRHTTTSVNANDPIVPIPERSIGGGVYDLFYLQGGSRVQLPQRRISDLDLHNSRGTPSCFYLKDNSIVLFPTPSSSDGRIEVWFYARPNDLVPSTSCGRIDSINSSAPNVVFTLNTDLSGTLAVGAKVDIVSTRSPNRILTYDAVVQSVTGVSVTLLLTSVTNGAGNVIPQLGDYLCPAMTSNIPLIPVEFHPVLAQMVSARIAEALGDGTKVEMVNAKLTEMQEKALSLISNRVEGETMPVVNRRGIFSALSRGNR